MKLFHLLLGALLDIKDRSFVKDSKWEEKEAGILTNGGVKTIKKEALRNASFFAYYLIFLRKTSYHPV